MKSFPSIALSGRSVCQRGFTLVELLLSMAVLSILMVMMVTITSQTSTVWRRTTGKVSQFSEARTAFESITRNLAQATLNTYYDYYDQKNNRRSVANAATFVPAKYGRYSDLHFQTGLTSDILGNASARPSQGIFFQAPLGYSNDATNAGLVGLVNTWGYYLEFRPDTDRPPFMSTSTTYRCRLMEFMEPSENLQVYATGSPSPWLSNAKMVGSPRAHVLASNIIVLTFLPKLPGQGASTDTTVDPTGAKLAPLYAYDSTLLGEGTKSLELSSLHQLPPLVEVTMVAIDEGSARNIENGASLPGVIKDIQDNLFRDASPDKRKADLDSLQEKLSEAKISFRVFRSDVSIRGAKWSRIN